MIVFFFYIAGDMITYNLNIQSSGHINDKTFMRWDFEVEVSRPKVQNLAL